MYLDEDTVVRVLRAMACLAPGTQVVFDYAIAPTLLGPIERLAFDEFAKRVAAAGEPWVSWFEPDRLCQDLAAAGFTRIEDLGPDTLNGRYLFERADGMRVGAIAHIISAVV
jgi:O-methyltransferase involved in polyketide biosynthesis